MAKDPELVKLIQSGSAVKLADGRTVTNVADLPDMGSEATPPKTAKPTGKPGDNSFLEGKASELDKLRTGLAVMGFDASESVEDTLASVQDVCDQRDEVVGTVKEIAEALLGKDSGFTKEELLAAVTAKAEEAKVDAVAEPAKPDEPQEDGAKEVADLGDLGKLVRFNDGGLFVVLGDVQTPIGNVADDALQAAALALGCDLTGGKKKILAAVTAKAEEAAAQA